MITTPISATCSGHMLSPEHNRVQLFKSCAGANMIMPIPIFVIWCDLSELVLFKDCAASLIVILLPLKRKVMFCTKTLATDPFSSAFMNCWLWFYYWFQGFYPKSLEPETPPPPPPPPPLLYGLWNLHQGHRLWNLHEGLKFIDGFKFICSERSKGNIFTVQIWIIHINIVACKMYVITSVRSWMGSMFHILDPWLPNIFPGIAKKKDTFFLRPKYITICWWQGLHATN